MLKTVQHWCRRRRVFTTRGPHSIWSWQKDYSRALLLAASSRLTCPFFPDLIYLHFSPTRPISLLTPSWLCWHSTITRVIKNTTLSPWHFVAPKTFASSSHLLLQLLDNRYQHGLMATPKKISINIHKDPVEMKGKRPKGQGRWSPYCGARQTALTRISSAIVIGNQTNWKVVPRPPAPPPTPPCIWGGAIQSFQYHTDDSCTQMVRCARIAAAVPGVLHFFSSINRRRHLLYRRTSLWRRYCQHRARQKRKQQQGTRRRKKNLLFNYNSLPNHLIYSILLLSRSIFLTTAMPRCRAVTFLEWIKTPATTLCAILPREKK